MCGYFKNEPGEREGKENLGCHEAVEESDRGRTASSRELRGLWRTEIQ
jgi:hypothetical protein